MKKFVVIILLALMIFLGGLLYYIEWDKKNFDDENKNFQEAYVEKEAMTRTLEMEAENCGISETFSSPTSLQNFASTNHENDSSLVCLGKNVVNNCKNSFVTIERGSHDDRLEIKKNQTDCTISVRATKEGWYNTSCSLNAIKQAWSIGPDDKAPDGTILGNKPGTYAGTLYIWVGFAAIDAEKAKLSGCTNS